VPVNPAVLGRRGYFISFRVFRPDGSGGRDSWRVTGDPFFFFSAFFGFAPLFLFLGDILLMVRREMVPLCLSFPRAPS